MFQSPGGNLGQLLNSFLSKICDENVADFSSFSVNSLASCWAIRTSSASEVVAVEETMQPTRTRGKLLTSAVTHGGVHLFRHRPDHFAGHSLVACPFADHPSPHVYLRLLASLLPPSTRQPDPVAVLLGQLRFIFSPISHSLGVDRETSSGCFSRVFLCIFYGRKFEFQAILQL